MMRDLIKKMMVMVLIAGCSITAVIPVYANEDLDKGISILCDFPEKKEI